MKIKELSSYLQTLERTSSRIEMTKILSEIFKKADFDEIDKIIHLIVGELAPSYEEIKLNMAEKMMLKIISEAYEKELAEVNALFKKLGDIGLVAESLASRTKEELSIADIYQTLLAVAQEKGTGSQERKIDEMVSLLKNLDPLSAKYISRIPTGKLRLGFSNMTILDALSIMQKGDKSARPLIENAFNVTADIGKIAKKIKKNGLKEIDGIDPEPGIPIMSSRAERLPSLEKIVEKIDGPFFVEPKYDGFRTQIHIYKDNNKKCVRIFSRNLENTTQMFPDLVEAIKKIDVEEAIFDSETIGFDPDTGHFLPFQETVQRKRKHGIDEAVKNFPLKLFIFDILYKNGKSLLNIPFDQRRKILEESVNKIDGIEITRQERVSSADVAKKLFDKAIDEGLEGIMIKKITAPYRAGARGYHWIKFKKSTERALADTIDCLVMGIYKGKGKRAHFGVGAFLIGVKSGQKFKTVSKVGTGLSDEQWNDLYEKTKQLSADKKPANYDIPKNLEPDIYLQPSLVVEILSDSISVSPIHSAKLALRFPRLIKFRKDKGPDQSTSLQELEKLYEMQSTSSH